tara:strand:+ start:226 stop:1389 length:1164 start_codon:yes stop_codon:yes gene_type:complete
MSIVLDLINFSFVVLIFLLALIYLRLEPLKALIILFHLIAIFLLNGVLFHPNYFSDQFNYFNTTELIRESFPVDAIKYHFLHRAPHYVAGTIFALFPLPFISSIYSLAMINFLIYLFMIIYIRKKKLNSNYVDFFFLLYPSLMLYSSLALRDILICLFMFLVLYHILIDSKYLLAFLYGIPLFLLKYQNALFIILTIPTYLILRNKTKNKLFLLILFSSISFYFLDYIPFINLIVDKVELFRFNMFAENYGYNWDIMVQHNYTELKRGLGLLIQVILGSFYFLATPFPWEIDNLFQVVQFMENLLILALLIFLNFKNEFILSIKKRIIFLNIFLFVSASINGLVVFNYGAIARYRFPFITVYFLFLLVFYYWNSTLIKLQPNYKDYR